MGGLKKTSQGIELSYRLLGILGTVVAAVGAFAGVTAATVRAADKLAATATRVELRDSLKVIHQLRIDDSTTSAHHETEQDRYIGWYGRQTWALVCSKYHNPEAFCKEPDALVVQAGRPR